MSGEGATWCSWRSRLTALAVVLAGFWVPRFAVEFRGMRREHGGRGLTTSATTSTSVAAFLGTMDVSGSGSGCSADASAGSC